MVSTKTALLINEHGIEPIVKLQVSTEHKHLNKSVASKYAAQGKC